MALPGFEVGSGWFPLLYFTFRCADEICLGTGDVLRIAQIKEKWGMLQIHAEWVSDDVDDLLELAEDASLLICEACGKPGSNGRFKGRWLVTKCSSHLGGSHISRRRVLELLNQSQVFFCDLKDRPSISAPTSD